MADCRIVCADVNKWVKEYDGLPFHAVLCDAPYHLGDAGFMSKDWDSGGADGVSCQPDTWRGIARHLLPGAFLFVFAGTINDDLISVAMRRAGLRKHHKCCLYWATGQGFPKSTRIDSQIDKAAGIEQEIIGSKAGLPGYSLADNGRTNQVFGDLHDPEKECAITAPAMPLARTWAGHRYGLQSIKPAVESILIFQKPYEGRAVDSIVETGAGALWIEGGRIATNWDTDPTRRGWQGGDATNSQSVFGNAGNERVSFPSKQGRWPANLLLAHVPHTHTCPDCDGDGCEACGGEGLVGDVGGWGRRG